MGMNRARIGRQGVTRLWLLALAVVVAIPIARWPARAQEGKAPGSAAVATVGPLSIGRDDFRQRAASGISEIQRRRGTQMTPEVRALVERQALESLIRANLLVLEAERQGVVVSDAEAEVILKRDPLFQRGGVFDEARFQALKQANPVGYRTAIQQAKREAAGRKLNESLQKRLLPDEAKLRAAAERTLTHTRIEALSIYPADFSGEYPEPRERDIVEYYRGHLEDFRRPVRAVLSIVRVNRPERSPSASTAERQRWEAGLRARAESLITAIGAGASLERAAESEETRVLSKIAVLAENFPGYWRGTARVNAAVFQTAAGKVLSEPVPADEGWLIVRVDESEPGGIAPLRAVAVDIRQRLREDRRAHHEDRALRLEYDANVGQMRGTGYRMRYAVLDTGTIATAEPSAADLDRYYRGHLADYTSYESATASIRVRPLAEVTGDVRTRWRREQRVRLSRDLAERLQAAWNQDRRDASLERLASQIREVGPLPEGAPVDSSPVGRMLTDTLASRGIARGAAVVPFARGLVVYHIHALLSGYQPTFEQVRAQLSARRRAEEDRRIEQAAREEYERDPSRVISGQTLHFTRALFEAPSLLEVPLTRREIERYHREHLDRYSAPELVHARHILVSPSESGAEALARARRKAEDLLRRVRAGEDFDQLARAHSDDPPTRESGGDLGFFGRGALLEPVEQAAFSLAPGAVSELVESEVGFHIVKTIAHMPLAADPLVYVYPNVGSDVAAEKALRIAHDRADSVLGRARTPQAILAAAARLGVTPYHMKHRLGTASRYPEVTRAAMVKMEGVPPGQFYPGLVEVKGVGYAIQWSDSITKAQPPEWTEARERAIARYRADAGRRVAEAKRAELDSLLASGWSFDSLAVLWGLPENGTEARAGRGLRGLASAEMLDSLVFGRQALARGVASDWIETPEATFKIRVLSRVAPAPNELANRAESDRRIVLERNLYDYYEELKRRFPVRILDAALRELDLPPPPEPRSS